MSVKAPEGLSDRSAALWRSAVKRGGIRSRERQVLLETALRALDRSIIARALIAREGIVVRQRRSKMSRPHPALRIASEAEHQFLKLWLLLKLDGPHDEDCEE